MLSQCEVRAQIGNTNMSGRYTAFMALLFFIEANADSVEDQGSFGFNHIFSPSTVKFNEIFSNSISMLADEPSSAKKDDFHLNMNPSQFVEFRIQTVKTTKTTTPKPKYLTAAYLNKRTSTLEDSSTGSSLGTRPSTKSTSPKPEEIQVLPLKNQQRGVLDLILPAARVKNFKNIFDTFRRVLSYTFRK